MWACRSRCRVVGPRRYYQQLGLQRQEGRPRGVSVGYTKPMPKKNAIRFDRRCASGDAGFECGRSLDERRPARAHCAARRLQEPWPVRGKAPNLERNTSQGVVVTAAVGCLQPDGCGAGRDRDRSKRRSAARGGRGRGRTIMTAVGYNTTRAARARAARLARQSGHRHRGGGRPDTSPRTVARLARRGQVRRRRRASVRY